MSLNDMADADLRAVQSGLDLAVGAVRRPVVFGEGLELQRVKRVLSASDVLHSVFSAAALAGETEQGGGGFTDRDDDWLVVYDALNRK